MAKLFDGIGEDRDATNMLPGIQHHSRSTKRTIRLQISWLRLLDLFIGSYILLVVLFRFGYPGHFKFE